MKTEYIPYTYLIGWSKHNLWYYGARYANNKERKRIANPSDLWVNYFTSSKNVKEIRLRYGEPDIIQIRRTFTTAEQAVEWENKVLRRIKAVKNVNFINQSVGNRNFRSKKGRAAPNIKQYQFLYRGKIIKITNLRHYCRENGLSKDGMYGVHSGKYKSHKGYTALINPRKNLKGKHFDFLYKGEKITIFNLTKFCKENNLKINSMVAVFHLKQKSYKDYTKYYPS